MLDSVNILGVKITSSDKDKILEYILAELEKPKKVRRKIVVFTPNPEQISAANRDSSLKSLLNKADVALPDGMGVVWAAKLLGKPIEARISGVDFMESLVKSESVPIKSGPKRPVVTGFFGGQPGVAEKAAECLSRKAGSGFAGQEIASSDSAKMSIGYASGAYDKEKMIHSDIDILFVGLGFPKQERWIIEHKDEIPASVIMAVGGSFDFISGRVPRAPLFVRLLGFEWLFRLANQPWRFWRQLRLLHFSALILREALRNRLK